MKKMFWSWLFIAEVFASHPASGVENATPEKQIIHRARRSSEVVGVYHWGGQHSRSISEGLARVAALNMHVARVTLSARYLVDYNEDTSCVPRFSLTTAAQQSDVREAFANPQIDVIMITAYDGVSFRDCLTSLFLNPSFYTPENTAAIAQEYSDFVVFLYTTYWDTGKRFIISNWEGDNTIYCGQAYAYATVEQFRNNCDRHYALNYPGNTSPADSIERMVRWFRARWQGIEEGRQRARSLGLSGVTVDLAPEFCIVRALRDNGFRSVLYDVIPFTQFDYVSYSSYESINRPDPETALVSDLDLIRSVTGTQKVILGEAGFTRSAWGSQTVFLTQKIIAAAISWGVSYVILWNLYDQTEQNDCGLFDLDGAITPLGQYYKQLFQSDRQ